MPTTPRFGSVSAMAIVATAILLSRQQTAVGSSAPASCWSYEHILADLPLDAPERRCAPDSWGGLVLTKGSTPTSTNDTTSAQPVIAVLPNLDCHAGRQQSPIDISAYRPAHVLLSSSAFAPLLANDPSSPDAAAADACRRTLAGSPNVPPLAAALSHVVQAAAHYRAVTVATSGRHELFLFPTTPAVEYGASVASNELQQVAHPLSGEPAWLVGIALRSPSEHRVQGVQAGVEIQLFFTPHRLDAERHAACLGAVVTTQATDHSSHSATHEEDDTSHASEQLDAVDACVGEALGNATWALAILFTAAGFSENLGLSSVARAMQHSLEAQTDDAAGLREEADPGRTATVGATVELDAHSAFLFGGVDDHTPYSTYRGSVTRPPCRDGALEWLVLVEPQQASERQVRSIRELAGLVDTEARFTSSSSGEPRLLEVEGNGRPTQPTRVAHCLRHYIPPLGEAPLPSALPQTGLPPLSRAEYQAVETRAVLTWMKAGLGFLVLVVAVLGLLLLHRLLLRYSGVERLEAERASLRQWYHEEEELRRTEEHEEQGRRRKQLRADEDEEEEEETSRGGTSARITDRGSNRSASNGGAVPGGPPRRLRLRSTTLGPPQSKRPTADVTAAEAAADGGDTFPL